MRAAGGVVWRRTRRDEVEVLVVHRPRYDDWSLPKGKADGDEGDLECALREVEEETGLRCAAGPELHQISYFDGKRRPKRVRYWAMQVIDGRFEPNDEVDEIRWVRLDRAGDLLTYAHDAAVVASLAPVLERV